jgi:hypothetical protein
MEPSPRRSTPSLEIKEYYHTTTFGSRDADGVYETLLNDIELEDRIEHLLVVDAHYT